MLKVSNSRIKTWRKCQNSHYYKYVMKIEPRKKKAALMKGSMIHEMDDAWTNGRSWKKVLEGYEKQYNKLFIEEKEHYGDIINDMKTIMEGYITKWKEKDLEYIKLRGTKSEHELEVDLLPGILFTGKIDKIGHDDKTWVWLVEKKSFGKSLPKEDIRSTDLQTTLYYWAAPLCGFPIPKGVMWDYVRAKAPAVPEPLKKGGLSKNKGVDTTYDIYLKAIKDNNLEVKDYQDILDILRNKPDNFYRRIFMPSPDKLVKPLLRDLKQSALEIKELGDFARTRNLTRDCSWCDYYSVCQAELRGLDTSYILKKEYQERRREEDGKEAEDDN